MASTEEVAQWMADTLNAHGWLDQQKAAGEIARRFGPEHLYENENGNPAIQKEVLKAFRKLTPGAVWERGDRAWRPRNARDDPNSRTAD